MVRCLALVMLAGCSFRSGGGATGDDAGIHDVAPDITGSEQAAPNCWSKWHDHSITFAPPKALASTGGMMTSDRDPSLSHDELTLYFSSVRGVTGDADIYESTRPDLETEFGTPSAVDSLNVSAFDDSKMTLSMDGLDVIFSSGRPPSLGQDLWQATRAKSGDDFTNITKTAFDTIDDSHDQYDPMLSDDGLTLYYSPFITGPIQVISMATRLAVDADFDTPVVVINSTMGDADPYLSPDQLVLLFSSLRSGGQGLIDVYYTVRDSVDQPWGAETAIPGINTIANEGDPVASRDGCTLYLSSDRDKGNAAFGLYAALAVK